MIKSFRNKSLEELFTTGRSRRISADLQRRVLRRLQVLHVAATLRDLDATGFACHRLVPSPDRYSISVNGPWRVTFTWTGQDALNVDLEQYH